MKLDLFTIPSGILGKGGFTSSCDPNPDWCTPCNPYCMPDAVCDPQKSRCGPNCTPCYPDKGCDPVCYPTD